MPERIYEPSWLLYLRWVNFEYPVRVISAWAVVLSHHPHDKLCFAHRPRPHLVPTNEGFPTQAWIPDEECALFFNVANKHAASSPSTTRDNDFQRKQYLRLLVRLYVCMNKLHDAFIYEKLAKAWLRLLQQHVIHSVVEHWFNLSCRLEFRVIRYCHNCRRLKWLMRLWFWMWALKKYSRSNERRVQSLA